MSARWPRGSIRECTRCGKRRRHCAKGLCWNCHRNQRRPPPTGAGPGGPGTPKTAGEVADRLAEYATLRDRNYTIEQAAARMSLAARTGHRYEARLKAQRGTPA